MSPIVLIITGLTISALGKILLAIAVIRVHGHLAREKRIDYDVLQAVRREKRVGLISIALIILGFIFESVFYLTAW